MISFFRASLLVTFALYWGGLTFYTGFVVRISHRILADPMDGGLITQQVTEVLQWLCLVAVLMMLGNALVVHRNTKRFGYALLGCGGTVAIALAGLFIVHGQLDAVIDTRAVEILDRDAFDTGHRRYNQLTTIQWIASLAYLPTTIVAWRRLDADRSGP